MHSEYAVCSVSMQDVAVSVQAKRAQAPLVPGLETQQPRPAPASQPLGAHRVLGSSPFPASGEATGHRQVSSQWPESLVLAAQATRAPPSPAYSIPVGVPEGVTV